MENYKKFEKESINTPEQKEKHEYGANIVMNIKLIRHPEKDIETGDITEKGKQEFLDKLREENDEDYQLTKFYLSPHKRPQQLRETIQKFLDEKDIATSIRTKEELFGRWPEFTPEARQLLLEELKKRELLTEKEVDKIDEKNKNFNAHEPATANLEKIGNTLLVEKFFNKEWPGLQLKGKDFGQEIKNLIDHFKKLSSRLKSNSKIKLVLIGHSGVIEYFNKLVYLKNHPELQAEKVDLKKIGGLIKSLDGPTIEIKSDEQGKQTVEFLFKDLKLRL